MINPSLCCRSCHTFADPLIEINFSSIKATVSSLLSSDGSIIASNAEESNPPNQLSFKGVFSGAKYLNTRHNFMEWLIEPYPCFRKARYKVATDDDCNRRMMWNVRTQ
jgi:hypothetical protein